MKYKIMGIVALLIAAILILAISLGNTESEVQRVHQHIEAKDKGVCTCNEFCTHLPIVNIQTGGNVIPGAITEEVDFFGENIYTLTQTGEKMAPVTISVFDNDEKNNHLSDKPTFTTTSLIRIRGHASRSFGKSQYLLRFVDQEGAEKHIPVLGMDAHNEWVLNGPYLDKSLIRNYMFYNISGEIMEFAPNVRFCEVFLDGDYRGVYFMAESISNGNNRRLDLNITEKDNTFSGYLLRLDRSTEDGIMDADNIYTMSERTNQVKVDIRLDYPGKANLTDELAKEIELEFSQFEKALFSYDYNSDDYGYKNYIDVDSFVTYYIINEFTKNMDAGRYSTYIYKRPGEKYKMCVWDFNNACDNLPDDETDTIGFTMLDKAYFNILFRDEDFVEKVIQKYTELRKGLLSDEYLTKYIDETVAFLGSAVARNTNRWNVYIQSDQLIPVERNVYTHEDAVKQLKEWLVSRGKWMDDNIDSLRQYCAESKVKKHNEVTE